jgi:anti-sigma factor RsiW
MNGHVGAWLDAYVDEELAPADRQWVEGHLSICAECRRQRASLLALRGLLGQVPAHAARKPADELWTSLRAELPQRRSACGFLWAWGGALAAVTLVAQVIATCWALVSFGEVVGLSLAARLTATLATVSPAAWWDPASAGRLGDIVRWVLPDPPLATALFEAAVLGAVAALALSFLGWAFAWRQRCLVSAMSS